MSATPTRAQPPRVSGPLTARDMAVPVPKLGERLAKIGSVVGFWVITALYAVVFTAISLRQYNAYVPHALDLGNMAQTFWNTVHGHPFRFQNMRAHIAVEAFGTLTRLSFHVEPFIPFMAVFYFFYQHVEALLVMQTLAVATGAIPTRLLARRHLHNAFAEVVFPLAYLLYPALEAANLYEFHPVTVGAPLILWAFYFADSRRYTLFALSAAAAMGCKEEMGLLIAMMGVWIAVRNREWQFGAVIAVLSAVWTFLALKVVVPHFNQADSSYWGRYVPPGFYGSGPVTQHQAIEFWRQHPGLAWENLTSEAKTSYLHRIFYPTGYLSLLSPITVLAAVPSLAVIMLSYEPHMISGLAHYSAEIVPVLTVGSILGVEWLANNVAPRLHIRPALVVAICTTYVLVAALFNQHDNGFSPIAKNFSYPDISPHAKILDRILAMIPPNASVSAQDNLNPHLSDREQIYLYPDTDGGRVQYIALDATGPTGSVMRTCDLSVLVQGNNAACDIAAGPATASSASAATSYDPNALLRNGKWTIVAADDGVLLLTKHKKGEPLVTTLPPQFWTFMDPAASSVPTGGPLARLGDYLELESFSLGRAELTNLRNPDILVTTWWKVLKPLPQRTRLVNYLTDYRGALQVFSDVQQATSWQVMSQWQVGKFYKVLSYQLSVYTAKSGRIDIDVGLTLDDQQYQVVSNNQPVTVLKPSSGLLPVGGGKVLKLTSIHATL